MSHSISKQVKGFEIKAAASGEVDLYLFGEIWDDTWLVKEIHRLQGISTINVYIDSMGGSAFQGLQLYLALKKSKCNINVTILTTAMSAATVIACAGDVVSMTDLGQYMIHNPWGRFSGDHEDMTNAASILKNLTEAYAKVYADKCGMDTEEILGMMKQETLMNATTALEKGFINIVLDTNQIAACKSKFIQSNDKEMDELKKQLGLPDNASEQEIVAAVKRLQDGNASAQAVATDAERAKQEAEKLKKDLEDAQRIKAESELLEKAGKLVDEAIAAQKITASEKTVWVDAAMKNFDEIEKMLKEKKGASELLNNPANAKLGYDGIMASFRERQVKAFKELSNQR